MTQLTKVKIKTNETEIHYRDAKNADSKETVFKSNERQSPEFLECLQTLKPYLLNVLDLPEDYGNGLKITALSLKHENPKGESIEDCGIVISGVKSLADSNAPACLNTPYIPPFRTEDTVTVMDEDLVSIIDDIAAFCFRFIQGGERAQGELFKWNHQAA